MTYKEGAQVKLECQSSGGRPAPKIEWLNVSFPANYQSSNNFQPPDARELLRQNSNILLASDRVRLLRGWWPHKKSSYFINSAGEPTASPASESAGLVPVTSSSVTISLSRYDLQSQFLCLVVPQQHNQPPQQQLQGAYELMSLNNQQAYLSSLLSFKGAEPMMKSLKLNIQGEYSTRELALV